MGKKNNEQCESMFKAAKDYYCFSDDDDDDGDDVTESPLPLILLDSISNTDTRPSCTSSAEPIQCSSGPTENLLLHRNSEVNQIVSNCNDDVIQKSDDNSTKTWTRDSDNTTHDEHVKKQGEKEHYTSHGHIPPQKLMKKFQIILTMGLLGKQKQFPNYNQLKQYYSTPDSKVRQKIKGIKNAQIHEKYPFDSPQVKSGLFMCKTCKESGRKKYTFSSRRTLLKHIKAESNKGRFKCTLCRTCDQKEMMHPESVTTHIRTVHYGWTIKCPICEKIYKGFDKFHSHLYKSQEYCTVNVLNQ